MMNRKITGFVLLLVILCPVLSGCGASTQIAELMIEGLYEKQNDYVDYNFYNNYDYSTQISESVVAELCEERNNNVDYDYSTAERNGNTLICEGTIYHEFNEYMVIKGEGVTEWSFDPKIGDWVCSDEVITMYSSLNTNVEGLWKRGYSDYYIRIRNMTSTGFEVYVDGINFDNWVFVTWNKYPYGFLGGDDLIDRTLEDGSCEVIYSGKTADGDKVEVRFTSSLDDEFEVAVSVDPPGSAYGTVYMADYENYKPE